MKSAGPCSNPARAAPTMVALEGNSLWNEIKVHIHLLSLLFLFVQSQFMVGCASY